MAVRHFFGDYGIRQSDFGDTLVADAALTFTLPAAGTPGADRGVTLLALTTGVQVTTADGSALRGIATTANVATLTTNNSLSVQSDGASWYAGAGAAPGGGATGATGATGTPGPTGATGSGAAIIPESGSSPIKISAFPTSAAAGMAPTALLTGLDAGGANANYTQAQILSGASAPVSSGLSGYGIFAAGGAGDGVGSGGNWRVYGGQAGITGNGGIGVIGGGAGGATSGYGGSGALQGGASYGSSYAGKAGMYGGIAHGTGNGGNVELAPGGSSGGSPGYLKFINVTVAASAAGLASGQVWINSSTRIVSVAP